MRTSPNRTAIVGLAVLVLAAPLAARADDDDDHDRARDLYEDGKIRALSDILRTVGRRAPGEIVAVDLMQLQGKWVYRLQILSTDGRRTTVDVDASAGAGVHGEGVDE